LGILVILLGFGRAGAADRTLTIDDAQSRMEIAVHATVDSFTARLAVFHPVITLDEQGNITQARLAFRFRDVLTGKDKRDAAMHRWQQTESFPAAVFDLQSLEKTADCTATAVGRLTLHGVTREVRFPISVARDGSRFAVDGDAVIDTREFELPVIRMLGLLKVDPQVRVRFHVQGTQTDAGRPQS
jgi:polyisoprenoid-binding protein YceI